MLPYVVYGKRQCKIVKQRHCEAVRHIKLLLPLIAIGEAKAFNQTWNMEWKVPSETRLETPLELLLLLSLTFESIVAASSVAVSQHIYLFWLYVCVFECVSILVKLYPRSGAGTSAQALGIVRRLNSTRLAVTLEFAM